VPDTKLKSDDMDALPNETATHSFTAYNNKNPIVIPADSLITIQRISIIKAVKPEAFIQQLSAEPIISHVPQDKLDLHLSKKPHTSNAWLFGLLALILLAGALFTVLYWPSSHPVSVPAAEKGKMVTELDRPVASIL
jgi:hypothetical protein